MSAYVSPPAGSFRKEGAQVDEGLLLPLEVVGEFGSEGAVHNQRYTDPPAIHLRTCPSLSGLRVT